MLPGLDMGVQSGGNTAGSGGGGTAGPGGGAFAIEFDPHSVSRTVTGRAPRLVSTGTATVLPSGGIAPYSYSWDQIEGYLLLDISTPTPNTATFSATLQPGDFIESVVRVTVTDAALGTAYADLTVNLHLVNTGTGEEV